VEDQGVGPRLCLFATEVGRLSSGTARAVAEAGGRLGFDIVELCTDSPVDQWTGAIDFVVALDASAVITAHSRIGPLSPHRVTIMVADKSPRDVARRAVRMVDVVVASPRRFAKFDVFPLRPPVLPMPTDDDGWRLVFDTAVANGGIHALA
jgi:hypothetical protein